MTRLLFFIFLFSSITAFAQEDEEVLIPVDTNEIHGGQGYLINMQKDTLYGYLEYKPYTMKNMVSFTDQKTGRSKMYNNNNVLKYTIGDRVLVSIPSQFVELIYKGDKANLYKLVEPVIGPAALGHTVALTIASIASQGWVKTNYFWYKKGVTKRINKISNKKVLLQEVINENKSLVHELQDKKWKQLRNDSTLIAVFKKYNQ